MQKIIETLNLHKSIKQISENNILVEESIKKASFLSLIKEIHKVGFEYLNYIYYFKYESREIIKYCFYSPLAGGYFNLDFVLPGAGIDDRKRCFHSITEIFPAAKSLEENISIHNKILISIDADERDSEKFLSNLEQT